MNDIDIKGRTEICKFAEMQVWKLHKKQLLCLVVNWHGLKWLYITYNFLSVYINIS